MPTKTSKSVNSKVTAKAKEVLAFAAKRARECQYSNELFNAIFSPTGKATELFGTEAEKGEFARTRESRSVFELIRSLPHPPISEAVDFSSCEESSITLRLPKSVRESLMKEAAAEGVPLDQLCLSKLVAQLRGLV